MKKFFIILFVNILLFVFLSGILCFIIKNNYLPEFRSFGKTKTDSAIIEEKSEKFPETFKSIEFNEETYKKFCGEKRVKFEKNRDKPPIIVAGCSYAYGHGLKKEESFPYLLSEYSGRSVYNYAICGGSFNLSADDFEKAYNGNFEDESEKEYLKSAEYVISIYMYDHINRTLENLWLPGIEGLGRFKLLNEIIIKIKKRIVYADFPRTEKYEKHLKMNLADGIERIKILAPNAKIIFIIYDEKIPRHEGDSDTLIQNKILFYSGISNSRIWNELENEYGIKVVHTKDITGFVFDKDYKLNADIIDWHPNAKAWQFFVPGFVKEYIK